MPAHTDTSSRFSRQHCSDSYQILVLCVDWSLFWVNGSFLCVRRSLLCVNRSLFWVCTFQILAADIFVRTIKFSTHTHTHTHIHTHTHTHTRSTMCVYTYIDTCTYFPWAATCVYIYSRVYIFYYQVCIYAHISGWFLEHPYGLCA